MISDISWLARQQLIGTQSGASRQRRADVALAAETRELAFRASTPRRVIAIKPLTPCRRLVQTECGCTRRSGLIRALVDTFRDNVRDQEVRILGAAVNDIVELRPLCPRVPGVVNVLCAGRVVPINGTGIRR